MKTLLGLLAPLFLAGCVVSADPGQVDGDVDDSSLDSAIVDSNGDSKMPDTAVADSGKPPVDTGSTSPDTGKLDTGLPDSALPDTGVLDIGPPDTGAGCKLSDNKACGPAAIGDGCLRVGGGATACGKMGTGTDGAACTKDQDCKAGHICDAPGSTNLCRRLCVVGSSDCGALTCKDFSTAMCGIGFCPSYSYGSVTYGFCGT